jgi:site-specific recombinase XerD
MDSPIAAYLERLQLKNFSTHTLRAYRGDLQQAEAVLGPLHLVDEDRLEAYAAGLARKLKPTSVRRKHAALRGFFEHCQRSRVRVDDPTKRFEAPKLEDRLPVYLSDSQIAQLLAALAGTSPRQRRDAAIVSCFYYTGMRAGELVGLDVADLAFDNRELKVFGKGKRERNLPITPPLGAALWAWLDLHPTKTGALFIRLTAPHPRLSYDAVADVVAKALARADLSGRHFGCHKLRHTFATRLINRKVSIDKIQKLLGHRRIDTTTIYAHTKLGTELLAELRDAL